MSQDPTRQMVAAASSSSDRQLLARLAALEQRVTTSELNGKRVFLSAGTPTFGAPDGTLCVDVSTPRLYARANGVWRYAGLT